jgi:hypothetical protein
MLLKWVGRWLWWFDVIFEFLLALAEVSNVKHRFDWLLDFDLCCEGLRLYLVLLEFLRLCPNLVYQSCSVIFTLQSRTLKLLNALPIVLLQLSVMFFQLLKSAVELGYLPWVKLDFSLQITIFTLKFRQPLLVVLCILLVLLSVLSQLDLWLRVADLQRSDFRLWLFFCKVSCLQPLQLVLGVSQRFLKILKH